MTNGYIYKPYDKLGLFEGAQAGQVVANPNREPPWLGVNHDLEGANIARWPGRLWRVEIMAALEPQNHRGNYTRSISVRIIEEIKTELLFGENGVKIEDILRYADAIDLPAAEALAALKSTDMDTVVAAGWHRWLAKTQTQKTDPPHSMNGGVAAGNGVQRLASRARPVTGDVFSAGEIEILLTGWAARPLKEGNAP